MYISFLPDLLCRIIIIIINSQVYTLQQSTLYTAYQLHRTDCQISGNGLRAVDRHKWRDMHTEIEDLLIVQLDPVF